MIYLRFRLQRCRSRSWVYLNWWCIYLLSGILSLISVNCQFLVKVATARFPSFVTLSTFLFYFLVCATCSNFFCPRKRMVPTNCMLWLVHCKNIKWGNLFSGLTLLFPSLLITKVLLPSILCSTICIKPNNRESVEFSLSSRTCDYLLNCAFLHLLADHILIAGRCVTFRYYGISPFKVPTISSLLCSICLRFFRQPN